MVLLVNNYNSAYNLSYNKATCTVRTSTRSCRSPNQLDLFHLHRHWFQMMKSILTFVTCICLFSSPDANSSGSCIRIVISLVHLVFAKLTKLHISSANRSGLLIALCSSQPFFAIYLVDFDQNTNNRKPSSAVLKLFLPYICSKPYSAVFIFLMLYLFEVNGYQRRDSS